MDWWLKACAVDLWLKACEMARGRWVARGLRGGTWPAVWLVAIAVELRVVLQKVLQVGIASSGKGSEREREFRD